MNQTVLGLLLAAGLALLPVCAHAQRRDDADARIMNDDDVRLAAHLALGFAGDADWRVGDFPGSTALDPTLGFGARVEVPVLGYLALGGMFEARGFQPRASAFFAPERYWVFDFDGIARVRYLLTVVEDSLVLEPYLGVPIGFTIGNLPSGDIGSPGSERVWPGFNVGVMAGAYLHTSARLGVMLELGWRHHEAFSSAGSGATSVSLGLTANQFAMNVGVSYLLD